MNDSQISIVNETAKTERIANPVEQIELGEWYWCKPDKEESESLWCVMHVGSNFARIDRPEVSGASYMRIHFDRWNLECRHEPNPQFWFDQWSQCERREIKRINQEIRDICTRLGVSPEAKRLSKSGGSELSLVSSATSTDDYKTELIKAKDTDLPSLFKQVQEHSGELKRWLSASSMSMKAQCGDLQSTIKSVEDRLFMVSIYAGLAEGVELVREGQPASIGEKLRLMQGKLYMDEECLLNYSHGGMEFKDIREFDAWIAKDENFSRILPFARCMVAFQVRRYAKERSNDGTLRTAWINFDLEQYDKLTFLYIRNGDRLYRLNTDLDFGDELFADRDEFVFEEMMVNRKSSSRETMPVRVFEDRVKEHKETIRKHRIELKLYNRMHDRFLKWKKENPDANESESGIDHKFRSIFPPYLHSSFNPDHWELLNESSVYLDDVNDRIRDQANEYNRISTMIQGLLDRSEVLHPHPPVKLWTPQGFDSFIELIYDHDRALFDGAEPPSWEKYKARCCESIGIGSVVFGQEHIWHSSLPRETRTDGSYYTYIPCRYTEGNPGPGEITKVREIAKKTKKVVFRWTQTRWIHRSGWRSESGYKTFPKSISIDASKLFNISAYKPGDYKQFFNDPRTRREYIKWAHLLLTAEEYHAGNLDPVTFERPKPQEETEDEE